MPRFDVDDSFGIQRKNFIMRAFAIVALSCLAFSSAPAIAKDDKPVDPDKKICRRTEATGSIIGGKRQCHTRAEWKTIDDANSEAAQRFSDRRSSTGH
jgi:hypothetical protein